MTLLPAILRPWWALPLAALCLSSCGSGDSEPTPVADLLTSAQTVDGRYISWEEHLVDDQELGGEVRLRGADGLQMADLDKDGIADIVSVHEDSSHIRVAFGSGDPDTWFRLSLAEGLEAAAVEDVSIGDLNGDGYPDIIAACEDGHLLYLQNPGGRTHNNTVRGWRWDRVIPRVTQGRGSFIRVFFADLNGDGRLEIVAANKGTGRDEAAAAAKPATEISWLEAGPDPLDPNGWVEHVLSSVRVPINAQPVDLDGDGDLDIFAGSRGEKRVFWRENLGGAEIAFREHAIEIDAAGEALHVEGFNLGFHDFNGDGRLDVVLSNLPSSVVWLEQPADPAASWKLHPIGSIAPDEPAGIALSDITGNGQPDVMVGGYSRGPREEDGEEITAADAVGRLTWFENPGAGAGAGAWKRHDISRRKRGMFDAFLPVDMDGDGDLDFVGSRGNSGKYDGVFWLEQLHSAAPVKVFTAAREGESEPLPLPGEP